GVYGVSFIVAWSSVCILCAAATLIVRTSNPGRTAGGDSTKAVGTTSCGISGSGHGPGIVVAGMVGDIIFPLLAVLSMTYWGACKVSSQPAPVRELGVALVQPSIPQRVVFDPRESTNRFQAILKLTELALATRPDLLVWPEASLPSFEPSHLQVLTNLIAQHRVWMVFGADDAVPRPGTDPEESTFDYFNSAFLFDPNGCFAAAYRKRHLVAFGEYIPLERVLPFMKYLTPVKTSFTPGPGPVRFKLDNPRAVISALICFEDVLPHLVREHVDPDTDFLLNLTNDAWFGESAAQWQHAVNAAFRAVENGLPLVRCTNNGLTCWIDACGRLRNVGFASQSDVYAPGFKTVRVPLLSNGERRALTFYTKHGDVFGWVCVLLAIGASSRVILSNGWKNSARGSCSVS
ncbi:MAG: apolipoprotein N-acyltransferase, partial [Verrucomicrobiae bacterium]|nr:apolipoprotein N-acyltransferase [Verrucomicrobiae bacterium]